MIKNYTFKASDHEKLSTTAYYPNTDPPFDCIIYVHGFKGFKDWGFVPHLGRYLSERGFLVVSFNFSHNGIGGNPIEFTELEKFAANTYSREIRELSEIIQACKHGFFEATREINVLGHSRGGGVALLAASREPEVKKVVTWSAISTVQRYSDDLKNNWRHRGYLEIVNSRTRQVMRLNTTLLDDIEQNGDDALSIEKAVRGLNKPLLVIHGQDDEAVPVAEAETLYKWADESKSELLLVPETGHTFGAKHPFDDSNEKLNFVLKRTAAFLKR